VSPDYIHTADDDVVVPPADDIGILSETSSSDSSDSSGSESELDTQPSNNTVTANGRYFCDEILFYFGIAHLLLLRLHSMIPEFYTYSCSSGFIQLCLLVSQGMKFLC
jgi:hypothetical protein